MPCGQSHAAAASSPAIGVLRQRAVDFLSSIARVNSLVIHRAADWQSTNSFYWSSLLRLLSRTSSTLTNSLFLVSFLFNLSICVRFCYHKCYFYCFYQFLLLASCPWLQLVFPGFCQGYAVKRFIHASLMLYVHDSVVSRHPRPSHTRQLCRIAKRFTASRRTKTA